MRNDNITPAKFDFRLLRLILLDSYSPGGEVIIDLADGAILTGDNGAGKTSLLSLIPIFYGENPSQCTTGSSSFAEFYLPHSTSYIIFEYERYGIPHMAVLYGVGEGSFNYRLIRNGYDLTLFTMNGDGATLISAKDLKVQLQISNVPHSNVLTLSEFRNVIQGRITGGRNSTAGNRALVNEYSFTSSKSHLFNIEKIVSGMFRRQANFDEFLKVIVDYISDDGNAPVAITGVREEYAAWPAQFAAYNEVMQHAGLMTEVDDLDAKLNANTIELRSLHGKLLRLRMHYAEEHRLLKEDRIQSVAAHAVAQDKFNLALLEHQSAAGQAKADAEAAESRLKAIDEQAEAYAKESITEKAKLFDSLPTLQSKFDSANIRKETLLGESAKIDQRYQTLAIEVRRVLLDKTATFNTIISRAHHQFEQDAFDIRQALNKADRALQDASAGELATLRHERDEAMGQVGMWKGLVKNPVADPALIEAHEKKRQEQAEAFETLHNLVAGRKGLESAKTDAVRAYVAQDAELSRQRRRIADLEEEQRALLVHLNPAPESLLHFLRANKPEWPADIAKVIREDVLAMDGLAPFLDGDGGSLYGVSLDLSRIEVPRCADETALQARLASCRDEHDEAKKTLQTADDLLATCDKRRAEADAAIVDHEVSVAAGNGRLDTIKRELAAAQRAINAAISNARQHAQQELARAEQALGDCDRRIKAAETALDDRRKACTQHHEAIENSHREKRDAALHEAKSGIDRADAEQSEQLQHLDIEKQRALSEQGVDTLMLQGIDREIDELRGSIRDANQYRDHVNAWRFWQSSELPERERYAKTAAEQRVLQNVADNECRALSARWGVTLTEFQRLQHETGERLDALERDQGNIQGKVAQLEEFQPSREHIEQELDATWSVGSLSGQAITLLGERKTLMAELVTRIRKIKASFSRVLGSPTEQYFNTIRTEDNLDDSHPIAWVKPLRNWYTREHEAGRHVLLMQASNYGALIADFHDKLARFHKDVGRFNSDIQRALNQVNVFRRISSIVIQFDSALDKLKYWGDVVAFNSTYQAWASSGSSGMPPPEFAEGLKRLVSHWEVREGIRAERRHLINIGGEVVENGHRKTFRTTADLGRSSSNGLSYLILCTIFIAFVQKIRGDARVQITWSVDELLDLDPGNIHDLLTVLSENGIRLVSACPEANMDILVQFAKRYLLQRSSAGHAEVVECLINSEGW